MGTILKSHGAFSVLGLPVNVMGNYSAWLLERLQQRSGAHVVTLNAEMTMQAQRNQSLAEIIRIGTHLGGRTETFFGLSGLGDMLATCSSSLSRNYQVGYGLAQGKSLEEILEELPGTAEGVNTTNVLIDIASRDKIPLPISSQVFLLLNGKITPEEAVEALMERDLKAEF